MTMNRHHNDSQRPGTSEPDPLHLQGITIEFALGDDPVMTTSEMEKEAPPIKSIVVEKEISHARERERSTPPRELRHEQSRSSIRSSGSDDSGGHRRPPGNMHVSSRRAAGNGSSRRPSASDAASVVTERSDRSHGSRGSVSSSGSKESARLRAASDAKSVNTSRTMKTSSTASSDNTAASDAERARRRIEREHMLEKKRVHDARRKEFHQQQQSPQDARLDHQQPLQQSRSERHTPKRNLDSARRYHSDGSMDLEDLVESPRSKDSRGGSTESMDSPSDSGTKSILKQGRFAVSTNSSGNLKMNHSRSRSMDVAGSSRSRGLNHSSRDQIAPRKVGVSFAETTVIHLPSEVPRPTGSVIPRGDVYPRVRHHPDERYGHSVGRGHGAHFYEAEDVLRTPRGVGIAPPPEYFDPRRHAQGRGPMPPHFDDPRMVDPRYQRGPQQQGALPGRPLPGMAPSHPYLPPDLDPRRAPHHDRRQRSGSFDGLELNPREQEEFALRRMSSGRGQVQPVPQPVQPRAKDPSFKLLGRNKTASAAPPISSHNQMRLAAANAAFSSVMSS